MTSVAAVGLAVATLPSVATAAGNSPAIQECVRDIAKMERDAARKFKGLERRVRIANLGKAKISCMDGKIQHAYSAAAKLRGAPQQALARQ